MQTSLHHQRGVTLVLALLIMAAVSAIAIAVSILVANEVIATRGITYSVASYYTAETATEQGLWIVKDARQKGQDIDETLTRLGQDPTTTHPSWQPAIGELDDARKDWRRVSVSLTQSIQFTLETDQSAFLELFNPGSETYAEAPRRIHITCGNSPSMNLQLSWTGWDKIYGFEPNTGKIYPYHCGDWYTMTQSDPAYEPTRFYIQIRAFDAPAYNVSVEVSTLSNVPISIPSQIEITSVGDYPDGALLSKQAIKASVPWLLPISGLYSYVLFSEEALGKP